MQQPGVTGVTMEVEHRVTGPGQFLVISRISREEPPRRTELALAISELVASMMLIHPWLIGEKIFEGPVSDDTEFTYMADGPFSLATPQEIDPAELSTSMKERFDTLQSLEPSQRSRFGLSSRWFLRRCEAQNPVDKLLFWFISLEIFPSEGKMDVVRAVRNLIHQNLYPDIAPGVISERIGIGRIHGLRSEIVHEGLSHVDLPNDRKFDLALNKLEAICRVCLRILAGLPPGTIWTFGCAFKPRASFGIAQGRQSRLFPLPNLRLDGFRFRDPMAEEIEIMVERRLLLTPIPSPLAPRD
jgi:hypothetical protein